MSNAARQGQTFHNFQKREDYIVRKLDSAKRLSKEERTEQVPSIPRHHDVNETGRVWRF